MAKLMWITNTTTWYEYELTPEEYKQYLEDEDKFMEEYDVLGSAEIVREKVLGPDDIELIDDEDEEDEEEFEDEE